MVTASGIRLPVPYPDENCYSILSRYAVRSGWLSSNQLSIVLYGNTMPLAGLLYKPFRTSDLRRWNDGTEWDVMYGENHSCLQYFTPFMDYDEAGLLKQCRKGMPLSASISKRVSRKCGLTRIRKKNLWYCPACVAEDFRNYGETYWRRLPQMPGVSYCARHGVRLHESGVSVSKINYRIFPASYVLIHIPDVDKVYTGNVFESEFIRLAEDTQWLLENGFRFTDNALLLAMYEEAAGAKLNERTVIPMGEGNATRFEYYLAARVLNDSARGNIDLMTQKYLSTIVTIGKDFGSFEAFWQNCGKRDKEGR